MSYEIILNLDAPEFQDNFPELSSDGSELWQLQANEKLTEFLTRMGGAASAYKKNIKKSADKLSSYHHAIFISGARGSGKTVFLRNVKTIWESQINKNLEKYPKLHFVDVIDPTLLNVDENFSEVIIASVYSSAEKSLIHADNDKRNTFYKKMTNLAEALGKSSEFGHLQGIDRIQKYRSGINLERLFHEFLIASVDLLDCDAIVLPIDDIDMKIDNAFDVLDDIRRLLSCPLILPLVSGDDDLYRHITTMKFEQSLVKSKDATNYDNGKKTSKYLSDAYITKIFPNHVRLPLQPIVQLLPNLKIKYSTNNIKKSNIITYHKYIEKIKTIFYPFCNGQERSTEWPEPNSARELTQLIRLIPPSMLDDSKNNQEKLWSNFRIWAEEKEDGAALSNAESYLYLLNCRNTLDLTFQKLISFNPILQKNHFPWANKKFIEQQIEQLEQLEEQNKSTANKTIEFNRKILKSKFENNSLILRSMPTIEYVKSSVFIAKDKIQQKLEQVPLLEVYTYSNYYNRSNAERSHVFFSRAFELLSWSILAVTNNIVASKHSLSEICDNTMSRVPFYSIFSVNPTKIEDTDDIKENNINEPGFVNFPASQLKKINNKKKLISEICTWVSENNSSLSTFNSINLIPLLMATFNKTFTQLNILRSNINKDNMDIEDLITRFKFIFINALASFIQVGEVINTNVAINFKSKNISNDKQFVITNNTLMTNLNGMFSALDSVENTSIKENNPIYKLVIIMWNHPIFKTEQAVETPKVSSTENELFNIIQYIDNIDDIKEFYIRISNRDEIRQREVIQWATKNKLIAQMLLQQINILSEKHPSIKKRIAGSGFTSRLYKGLYYTLINNEAK